MNEILDWRGTTIEPGSTIIYPGRYSSSIYMVEGVVIEAGLEKRNQWDIEVRPYLKVKPLLQKGAGRARVRTDKEVKITRVDLVTVLE